jgi:histone deacetylase 11
VKVIYSNHYNFKLGLFNYLHPFDGTKFKSIYEGLGSCREIEFIAPEGPVSMAVVDEFLSSMMRKDVRDAVFIFRALEFPKIPFMGFSFLDRKILTPMRWGVAGTIYGAEQALSNGGFYWNLAGGYHHAMQQNMEGFCIYNDIGICHQQMVKKGLLSADDKILIIDTDAHHGNGNAYTFMENDHITLLDIYNASIYPASSLASGYTCDRVNIPVQLKPGTRGETYLSNYRQAIAKLEDNYRLAFVVAGTDVLLSDKLGGLCLSIDDVVEREKVTLKTLSRLNVPTVILGGGGYSKESAKAVIQSIGICSSM